MRLDHHDAWRELNIEGQAAACPPPLPATHVHSQSPFAGCIAHAVWRARGEQPSTSPSFWKALAFFEGE